MPGKRQDIVNKRTTVDAYGKVLERVVHTQLMSYMDQHQFWHPQHNAYRSHHSTTTAMLSMHGKIMFMAMVDMSAASVVVDIDLLLEGGRSVDVV